MDSKTTFVTVNHFNSSSDNAIFPYSKTTFVTVNLKKIYRKCNSNNIQKQPLLLLIGIQMYYDSRKCRIQKQPLLLLIEAIEMEKIRIRQNSKTTFVTVNLTAWTIFAILLNSKTTFVTVNLKNHL